MALKVSQTLAMAQFSRTHTSLLIGYSNYTVST